MPEPLQAGQLSLLNGNGNTFRPRKAHKKSRGGCAPCKRRRIKCSEGRPSCTRCGKLKIQCDYPAFTDPLDSTTPPSSSLTPPDSAIHNLSVELAKAQLAGFIGSVEKNRESLNSLNLNLLHHFQTVTAVTLDSAIMSDVFRQSAAKLAWEQAYLMHLVLAVSAAHMKRLLQPSSAANRYQLVNDSEAIHWQMGLQLFSARFATQNALCGEFDPMVAATVLTTIFSFALNDEVPIDTFSTADPEIMDRALYPLGATGGFRALQSVFTPFDWSSLWAPVLCSADDDCNTFSREPSGIDHLPPAFVRLCGLDVASSTHKNPYQRLVSLLTPLLRLTPNTSNYVKLMAYIGRTWTQYKPLLIRKDPRALLLLSYWLTLVLQVDQWWILTRARTECKAIVEFLCSIDDADIHALLLFPASHGEMGLSNIW